jgi:hypothetical protein
MAVESGRHARLSIAYFFSPSLSSVIGGVLHVAKPAAPAPLHMACLFFFPYKSQSLSSLLALLVSSGIRKLSEARGAKAQFRLFEAPPLVGTIYARSAAPQPLQ